MGEGLKVVNAIQAKLEGKKEQDEPEICYYTVLKVVQEVELDLRLWEQLKAYVEE